MASSGDTMHEYIITMLNNGLNRERIEEHLVENGHEIQFVKEVVRESVKLRYAKRRSHGLSLILCGAVICFASFLLTITSSFTHSSFGIVLYGLTTVGIIVVFAGFTKIF